MDSVTNLKKVWTTPIDLQMGDIVKSDEKVDTDFSVSSSTTQYICKQINETEAKVVNLLKWKSEEELSNQVKWNFEGFINSGEFERIKDFLKKTKEECEPPAYVNSETVKIKIETETIR